MRILFVDEWSDENSKHKRPEAAMMEVQKVE